MPTATARGRLGLRCRRSVTACEPYAGAPVRHRSLICPRKCGWNGFQIGSVFNAGRVFQRSRGLHGRPICSPQSPWARPCLGGINAVAPSKPTGRRLQRIQQWRRRRPRDDLFHVDVGSQPRPSKQLGACFERFQQRVCIWNRAAAGVTRCAGADRPGHDSGQISDSPAGVLESVFSSRGKCS
jgi:hypothetical protein